MNLHVRTAAGLALNRILRIDLPWLAAAVMAVLLAQVANIEASVSQ